MLHRPHLDFIVVAYPRSGTTWLANWLTTDRSLCLHDPFSAGMPETWPLDTRFRGISCTGSYMLDDWLDGYACPIAVIERDRRDCDASLARIGLECAAIPLSALDRIKGRRFAFDSVWDESGAKELWAHLLPEIPFDALRYRELKTMQVQPHMQKWRPDEATIRALVSGGHFNLQGSM